MHTVTLVPQSCFGFCYPREVHPGVSIAANNSRSQACLRSILSDLRRGVEASTAPCFPQTLVPGCSGTPGKLVAASRPRGLLRDGSQVHLPTSDLRKLCHFRASEDLRKLFLESPFARGGSRLRDTQVQCSNRSCFCWLPIHLSTATFSCSLHLSFGGLPCLQVYEALL